MILHLTIHSGLLLTSQLHNASQLSAWCLHFISSNYVVFKDKEEFSHLTGDNMEYVDQHRWPPLSYEQAMEEYRKKYLEEDSDDSEENNDSEGEGGSDGGTRKDRDSGRKSTSHKSKKKTERKSLNSRSKRISVASRRGRTSDKCKVM